MYQASKQIHCPWLPCVLVVGSRFDYEGLDLGYGSARTESVENVTRGPSRYLCQRLHPQYDGLSRKEAKARACDSCNGFSSAWIFAE